MDPRDHIRHIKKLAEIGTALSSERNIDRLLEMIVDEARTLTSADAGTLYIVDKSGTRLDFVILQNDTMNTRMGGTSGVPITLPPVRLYGEDGSPNHANVSSYSALTGEIVNIEDVYEARGFDFTGPRKYDAATGYRSKSMLVIPMQNHEDEIIGVLQLLNAVSRDDGKTVAFDSDDIETVASLASQAAVALTNARLLQDLKDLLYSFIKSIATAIDAKSPYTAGHIARVVDITMMIAEAVNRQSEGKYAETGFSEEEMEELKLAAWMHDVGKITTPEHVVDKSTKLQTIFDRVELVKTRFALIRQSMKAEHLAALCSMKDNGASPEALREAEESQAARLGELDQDLSLVLSCAGPGFMPDDRVAKLAKVATKVHQVEGEMFPYLTGDEFKNLAIRKGTLTDEERRVIENHALMTHKILSELPFPKRLGNVPRYAGGHHEKLDGTGYPLGLTGDDLPLQARILAVADIFEALTAKDRPYKTPMKLSKAMEILGFMVKDGHIDPEVFNLFTAENIHKAYGKKELNPDQMDLE